MTCEDCRTSPTKMCPVHHATDNLHEDHDPELALIEARREVEHVTRQRDEARAERDALKAHLNDLERENARLRAQISALREVLTIVKHWDDSLHEMGEGLNLHIEEVLAETALTPSTPEAASEPPPSWEEIGSAVVREMESDWAEMVRAESPLEFVPRREPPPASAECARCSVLEEALNDIVCVDFDGRWDLLRDAQAAGRAALSRRGTT